MTKFAGAALAPAIAMLFILAEAPRPQKIKYIVMTFLSVLVPFLLWTYRTFTLTSTFNGFGLGYVPIQRGNLITAFITLFTWFLPDSWLFVRERLVLVLACIFLAVVAVYAFRARKDIDNAFTKLLAASAIFCSAYMFIVIFAKVFLDHGIGFRDRMLIPMFPFLLLSLVALLAYLAAHWPAWGARVAAAGLVYMGLMLAPDAAVVLPPIYENGLGWNNRAIVTSAGIQELKGLAA